MDLFLNIDQLKALTGKRRRNAQATVLRLMGITHEIRPDGMPIVLYSHLEKRLGGLPEKKLNRTAPNFDNINGP